MEVEEVAEEEEKKHLIGAAGTDFIVEALGRPGAEPRQVIEDFQHDYGLKNTLK